MNKVRHYPSPLLVALLLIITTFTPGVGLGDPGQTDDPTPKPPPDPIPEPTPPGDETLQPLGDGVQDYKSGNIFKLNNNTNKTKVKAINLLHNTWSYDSNVSEVQVNVTGDRTQLLIVHPDIGNVNLDMNFTYGKGKTFVKSKDKEKISYKTSDLNMTFMANTSTLKEVIVVEKEKAKLFPLNWTVNVTSGYNLKITRTNRTIFVDGIAIFWLQAFTAINNTNGTVALNVTYSSNATTFNISLDLGTTIDNDDYPLTIDPTVTIDVCMAYDLDTRCIAVNSSGTMYTAYFNGTNIEYQTSTDSGKTWGGATIVHTDSHLKCVVMCIDSNDNLHFAWRDSSPFGYHKVYWVGNSTWGGPYTFRDNSGNWDMLLPDGNGNVHLFYCEWNGGTGPGDLNYTKWDGDSWSAHTTIHIATDNDDGRPEAVITSNGNIHVVFHYYATTQFAIGYMRSTTGGASWDSLVQLDASLGGGFTASIATDSDDNLHVLWQGKNATHTNWQAVYKKHTFGGSWGSEQYLTDLTGTIHRQPTISVDLKDDTIYAIWTDEGGSSLNDQVAMRYSTDKGSTWAAETVLVDRTAASRHPTSLHYAYPSDVGNVPYEGVMFAFVEDYGGTPDHTIYYSSDWLLYFTPADPPPGGGGGSGGGGEATIEPGEYPTCCSSTAAMGIIITSSICLVGWTRRRER